MRTMVMAVTLLSTSVASGCGPKDPAVVCAEMAKKCIPKAMDESVEELTGECRNGIRRGKAWATKSSDCTEKHGDDCAAFRACAK